MSDALQSQDVDRDALEGVPNGKPALTDEPWSWRVLFVEREHDAHGEALGVEVVEVVEHVPEIELRPNPEIAAAMRPKVHAASDLKGEVVDVASAAVIEADERLDEGQDVVASIRNPQSRTAEK